MKKLMITAAAVALAGGAFAANIYDYKASVKYVDFKRVSAKNDTLTNVKCWVKVVKSATLQGYLCTPIDCECNYTNPTVNGECFRFGNAPGFLVVQNKAANKWSTEYGTSKVKLMPANLLTEWWATKRKEQKDISLQAQGYLFAGVGKRDVPDPYESPFYGLGDYDLYPEMRDLAHEYRTAGTQFLFGQMNVSEEGEFIEPFLDHAGFGKAKYYYNAWTEGGEEHPCIWDPVQPKTSAKICLLDLSGTLIGGSYACLRNATLDANVGVVCVWQSWNTVDGAAENWLCQGWDDKKENAFSVNGDNNLQQTFSASTKFMYNVVCGNWSIKANTKLGDRCDVLENVKLCGQKIDSGFRLSTFDRTNKSEFNALSGNFACKWFDVYGKAHPVD